MSDFHLNRTGALILAAVSLIATIIILAGGSSKTDAQLAAAAALKHGPQTIEEIVTTPAAASGSGGSATGSGGTSSGGTNSGGGSGAAQSGGGGSSNSGSTNSGGGGSSNSGSDSSTTSTTSTTSSTSTTSTTTTTAADAGLPKVGHVFLLSLSTPSYKTAFGARSAAPYLRTLARRGTVLTGYHALAKNGLADLLATVSGQAPNADTLGGCAKYVPFPVNAVVSAKEIASGTGCIYPDAAITLADQVNSAGDTWGAYVQDMGLNNCSVPQSGTALDTPIDGTQEGYDVAHNPFAFFGSLLDEGGCSEHDQDLGALTTALAKKATTPDFTFLSGDACVDGDPTMAPTTTTTTQTAPTGTATGNTGAGTTTTATSTTPARLIPPAAYGCPAGEPFGIAGENAFLKTWVPKILASAAYKANGVLIVAFTNANGAPHAKTGVLVISRWTPHGKKIATSYTAYSLLRSIEDMLDLATLAHSADAPAFAKQVLTH